MVKMVCEALGYGPFAAQRGGYPNGYLQQAAQNKLLTGVSLKAGDHVPTQAALTFIYNALFADMGVFVSEKTGQYVDFSGMTLLKYVFEVEKISGIVTSDDRISLWGEPQAETGKLLIGEKSYQAGNVQSGEFLGYAVDAYIANDGETILMLHKTDKNSVLIIPGTDVMDLLESGVKYAADGGDSKEKTAKINRETALFYNRNKIDAKSLAAIGVKNGRITLVDNNSDGVYDVLLAESFISEQVASVDNMNKTIYLKSGKKA